MTSLVWTAQVLGAVVVGLGLHQDGDEDRLDQQGDRDQGQAP